MNYLIIGCGYLGQRVAALWRAQGQNVFATTRRVGAAESWRGWGLEPITCNILDPISLKRLPQVHTVVHAISFDRAAGPSMREVYVDGLANVLDQLPTPERFIYVGSSSVYGQTDETWVDEDAATEPQEEVGKIVLDAEKVLRQRLPQAILLRFAGIYGPGRLLRQESIQAGKPIVGNPDRWLNLIHVDDGARAVVAAAGKARPGRIYNVCDGQPVPRRDFYVELARWLKAPGPQFILPPPGAASPHEKSNRRIANRRMTVELSTALMYADYRQGLAASVAAPATFRP